MRLVGRRDGGHRPNDVDATFPNYVSTSEWQGSSDHAYLSCSHRARSTLHLTLNW